MFTYQTILLNRVFKTNDFSMIKPRVYAKTDKIVFVLPEHDPTNPKKAHKLGGVLVKVFEETDDFAFT